MKLPMDSKKRNQLKKKLLPIHEDIRNLAKPHTAVSTKRKILKKPQVLYLLSYLCSDQNE